jgi:hypothetical protein
MFVLSPVHLAVAATTNVIAVRRATIDAAAPHVPGLGAHPVNPSHPVALQSAPPIDKVLRVLDRSTAGVGHAQDSELQITR